MTTTFRSDGPIIASNDPDDYTFRVTKDSKTGDLYVMFGIKDARVCVPLAVWDCLVVNVKEDLDALFGAFAESQTATLH